MLMVERRVGVSAALRSASVKECIRKEQRQPWDQGEISHRPPFPAA